MKHGSSQREGPRDTQSVDTQEERERGEARPAPRLWGVQIEVERYHFWEGCWLVGVVTIVLSD